MDIRCCQEKKVISRSILSEKGCWKVKVHPRYYFFHWLNINGKILTNDKRKSKSMVDSEISEKCSEFNLIEKNEDVVFECKGSKRIWNMWPLNMFRGGKNMELLAYNG